MRPIDAVIFDMDGIIVDSERVWEEVRRDLVLERGLGWPPDSQRRMMGMNTAEWSTFLSQDLGLGKPPEEVAREVIARMKERYHHDLPLIAGADEAVIAMAAVWPLGLASSSPPSLIEYVLAEAGLSDCFRVRLSTEEVPKGKPAPDVYLEVAARLGFEPARCAAIEDSSNGLRSASRAGMLVVAIPNQDFPPDPDALALVDVVLARTADLRPASLAPSLR